MPAGTLPPERLAVEVLAVEVLLVMEPPVEPVPPASVVLPAVVDVEAVVDVVAVVLSPPRSYVPVRLFFWLLAQALARANVAASVTRPIWDRLADKENIQFPPSQVSATRLQIGSRKGLVLLGAENFPLAAWAAEPLRSDG